jgi:FkbM family methyltransferase
MTLQVRQRDYMFDSRDRANRVLRELTPPIFRHLFKRFGGHGRAAHTGLDGLAARLMSFLPPGPGYFVELGANDGIRQSNTYWLERDRGWSGLLIEPALNRFFELKRNRSAANSFACAACVPFDYQSEFVAMQYADLMTVSRDLRSDLPDAGDHIASAQGHMRPHEEVVVFGAHARTLQSLLDAANAPPVVDLLSLDVEGAEAAVLRGVDHERTRFRHILVESWDVATLQPLLESLGYTLRAQLSHHDYLFADDRTAEHRQAGA